MDIKQLKQLFSCVNVLQQRNTGDEEKHKLYVHVIIPVDHGTPKTESELKRQKDSLQKAATRKRVTQGQKRKASRDILYEQPRKRANKRLRKKEDKDRNTSGANCITPDSPATNSVSA